MRRDRKATWISHIVLCVWLICAFVAFGFVYLYGLPIPYADEWANVPQAVGQRPISLEWLWSLHNEHRLPLFRLSFVALTRASGNNFRTGMFFNVFAMTGLALAMLIAVRKLRGRVSIFDIFLPLCLVSLGQYENLLSGNQMQFVLITVFLSIILLIVSASKNAPPFLGLCVIGVLLLLLPLCGSAGLVAAVPMLLWLHTISFVLFRTAGLSRSQFGLVSGLLIAATTTTILYFVNYNPVFFFRSYAPADIGRGSLEFLATSFGPAGIQTGMISSPICVILIGATAWLLAVKSRTEPEDRFRISGMLSLLIGLLLLMISVGVGRSGAGPGAGAAHRYTTLTTTILCLTYFTFMLYGGKITRYAIPAALLIGTVAVIPGNTRTAMQFAIGRQIIYQKFCKDIKSRLPIDALAVRDMEAVFPFYTPMIPAYIRLLQEYSIGPFAELNKPLPEIRNVHEINLPMIDYTEKRMESDRFGFTFKRPQYLLGFKPTFVIQNFSDKQPQLYISWRSEDSKKNRTIRFPLGSSPQEQTYSFWIYDSVSDIQIIAPGDRLQLRTMTLLVKEKQESEI